MSTARAIIALLLLALSACERSLAGAGVTERTDYYIELSNTGCIDPTQLPTEWTMVDAAQHSIGIMAMPEALGLAPDPPSFLQSGVRVTVSTRVAGVPYLIASPQRVRDNEQLGLLRRTGRAISDPRSQWRFEETNADSFIDFATFAQCKSSPRDAPPEISHVACSFVSQDGRYYVALGMSSTHLDALPLVFDRIGRIASGIVVDC